MIACHELLQGTVAQDRSVMHAISARARYIFRGKRFLQRRFLRYVIADHRGEARQLINLANVRLLYCYHALKKRGLFENVETNMKATKLQVNDLVRVKQSQGGIGPTLYLLEWIGERGHCVIREAGNALAGGQEFDLSLLAKVDRDGPKRVLNARTGRPVTREEVAARFE